MDVGIIGCGIMGHGIAQVSALKPATASSSAAGPTRRWSARSR